MDFYYMSWSAPCRSVMLTAAAVGVELNKKVVNLLEGEHLKPDFLAVNFQHTLPTLVDGDLKLWESRAICAYLASKYGKEDSLCPKDPVLKAMVDRMLYLSTNLYTSVIDYYFPILKLGLKANPDKIVKIQKNLSDLNKFLEGQYYVAGNDITIADHSIVASVSGIEAMGIDFREHTNVVEWLERCKTNMPGYDTENGEGVAKFGEYIKSKA